MNLERQVSVEFFLLRSFSLCFFLIFIPYVSLSQAGNITLSTYYPSPFGVYDRMRLMPHDTVADPVTCDATTEGMLINDSALGSLRICKNNIWSSITTAWKQVGDSIYPADTLTNSSLAIGIGTTSPMNPLHIKADSSDNDRHTSWITGTNDIGVAIGSTQSLGVASIQGIDTSALPASAVDLHLNPNGGLVAIGKNNLNPVSDLHLEGESANWTSMRIENIEGGLNSIWELRSINQVTGLSFDNDFSLWGGAEGSEDYRMTVKTNGRVGIGTIDPQAKLDVRQETPTKAGLFVNNLSVSLAFPRRPLEVLTSTTANMLNGFGSGILFGIEDGAAGPFGVGSIDVVRQGADNRGMMVLSTNDGSSSDEPIARLWIDPDGLVGIGTAAPTKNLTITDEGNDQMSVLRMEQVGISDTAVYEFRAMEGSVSPDSTWSLGLWGGLSGAEKYRMIISSNDRVGINVMAPMTTLHVGGDVTANAYFYSSDQALKTDVETISGLDLIRQLRGVRFKWQADQVYDVGVIAQEVEAVVPELVMTDSATGLKSVKYANLIAPLIEAVKEQDAMIEKQAQQMRDLQNQYRLLSETIDDLKRMTDNKGIYYDQ